MDDIESCRRLWMKHLQRVAKDATEPLHKIYCGNGTSPEHAAVYRAQARAYILTPGNGRFEWVCYNLGLIPDAVREETRRRINEIKEVNSERNGTRSLPLLRPKPNGCGRKKLPGGQGICGALRIMAVSKRRKKDKSQGVQTLLF